MDATVQPSPPAHVIWGPATTPLGKVLVGITPEGRLCRVTYLRDKKPADVAIQWQFEWPHTRFKNGKVPANFTTLPLLFIGTELQKHLWLQIMEIPAGTTQSYGMVAESAGAPGRARAVGKACRDSCLAYIVPCHRVVAAGGLGGYGPEGTAFKQQLLKAEGLTIKRKTKPKPRL